MPKLLGLYDASEPKMDCIQKNYLLPTPVIYGEEDCLYLNVYRPEVRCLKGFKNEFQKL